MNMPVSKAQKRAINKYNKNHYDNINIRVPKGKRENISAHANKYDGSLNKFVNRAISETMERDKEKDNK